MSWRGNVRLHFSHSYLLLFVDDGADELVVGCCWICWWCVCWVADDCCGDKQVDLYRFRLLGFSLFGELKLRFCELPPPPPVTLGTQPTNNVPPTPPVPALPPPTLLFMSMLEFESSLLRFCAICAAAICALADFLLFSSLKQWFFWCRINS